MYGIEDKQRIIAFDYDETISRNPQAFLKAMEALELGGFHVIVVTYRNPNVAPEDLLFLQNKGYKVYFTSHCAKKVYMKENHDIEVDIWVDDCPESVLFHYSCVDKTFYRNGIDFKDGDV